MIHVNKVVARFILEMSQERLKKYETEKNELGVQEMKKKIKEMEDILSD